MSSRRRWSRGSRAKRVRGGEIGLIPTRSVEGFNIAGAYLERPKALP